MKTKRFISLPFIALMVLTLSFIIGCKTKKDTEISSYLDSIKYGDIVNLDHGFYKGCKVRLEDRKSFYIFHGYVVCENRMLFSVQRDISASEFSSLIREYVKQ